MAKENECFIISPIGEEGSTTREHADNVFEHVVKDPIDETGYEPVRADHLDEPGDITRQIFEHIHDAPLVIADLWNKNPNVFYELAIRHSVNKPAIQIVNEDEKLPFDLRNSRTVFYDLNHVPTNEDAKQQIIDQIGHIEESDSVESPVSEAVRLQSLRESDDPEQQSLGKLQEDINDLQSTVYSLEDMLESNRGDIPSRAISTDIRDRVGLLSKHLERTRELQIQMENIVKEENIDSKKLDVLFQDMNQTLNELETRIYDLEEKLGHRSLDSF